MQIAAQNRKARYNYFFIEVFEAGIQLMGSEIKSLRDGRVDISESFAREVNNEIFLINSYFSKYASSSYMNHDELRPRKLLLHKKEIKKWDLEVKRKNYIIVPLNLVITRGKAKLKIGLGKSKRKYDKRVEIRNREAQRDIDRTRKANK